VKKQFLLLLLGLFGVLLACGQLAHATVGAGPNDIEDALPGWNFDGSRLAWERTAPGLQHIVTSRPDGADLYVSSFTGVFRGYVPQTTDSLYMLVQDGPQTILTIGGRFGGPHAILHGTDASASPDGTRVAYLRDGTLYVARIDNLPPPGASVPSPTVELALATGVQPPPADVVGPVWSPDGTQIAIASGNSLLVVPANASRAALRIAPGDNPSNPSWSYDGRTIAFEHQIDSAWSIVFTAPSGGSGSTPMLPSATVDSRFPQFSPASDTLAFISDRQRVGGGATTYEFALYVRDGRSGAVTKVLDDVHPYSPPAWNPSGTTIAVAAGQECQRWGIYLVDPQHARAARRLSNRCRYDGTAAADTLQGSQYFDIINGFAGNDHLEGLAGNDKILGENGNDVLLGDAGNDVLFGGPGNDVISGGAGDDTIIPGNGADHVDCGAGNDTVEGAGPLDHIAKNCEHVRR
jgi:hypothetical protein